jgi:DNA-binding protein H-NS
MARKPDEEKAADAIIAQLAGLDAASLGRVAEAAGKLKAEKTEAERAALVAQLRELAEAQGYRPEDLFAPAPAGARKQRATGIVPVKYRHGDREWSGRGKAPAWLLQLEAQGKDRELFRVADGGDSVGSG